jgi:hypothetical protein
MWTDEPFLYHSLLASAMNMKLLYPREAIDAAVVAFRSGKAPLNAAEGFIRQILGWREYVRGVYWRYMPEYRERNFLKADLPLPKFYWTAETDMNCLHQGMSFGRWVGLKREVWVLYAAPRWLFSGQSLGTSKMAKAGQAGKPDVRGPSCPGIFA